MLNFISLHLYVTETLIKNYHKTIEQGIKSIEEHIVENQKQTQTKLNEIGKIVEANFISIQTQLLASTKKQQTNTHITWGLIIIGIIAIILTCKN
jgi:hypothetical protein